MLIEAAWSYQYPVRVARDKAEILIRLPNNVGLGNESIDTSPCQYECLEIGQC